MYATVVWREFGMKRRGHPVALTDQGWAPIALSENFNPRAGLNDARSTDEYHLELSAGQFRV